MKALKHLAVLPFIFILTSCGGSYGQDYSYQQETTYSRLEYEALLERIECYEELLDDASYALDGIDIDYDTDSVDDAINEISDIDSGWTWKCT